MQLSGPGPYHQLDLPLAWQSQSGRDDLGDVRIVNASGQQLPHAWVETPDPAEAVQQTQVTLFQWNGPRAPVPVKGQPTTAPMSPTSPSWPIWVMDLRKVGGRLQALQLTLPEGPSGIYAMALEASADLQSWTTVQDAVQLARLSQGGQSLQNTRIELGGISAAYLRLRLLPGSPTPTLGEVLLSTRRDAVTTPPWSWSAPIQAARCGAQYCDYPVPAQVAIGRIKVRLTEANTLMRLQVMGLPRPPSPSAGDDLADGATSGHHHHGVRARLHALRQKARDESESATPSDPDKAWSWLGEGQVHWIDQGHEQVRSEELPLNQGHHRMLRLQAVGGDAGWTKRPPAIEVATWLHSLVFLSRGAPPYRLSWAAPDAAPTAMPMAQLVPDVAQRRPGAHGLALLPPVPDARPDPVQATQPASAAASSSTTKTNPIDRIPKAWWLWATLLIGLGLMAYMARAVLSSSSKDQAP